MRDGAVRDGNDRGIDVDGAPFADSAGPAGTGGSADALIVGERTVGDRQDVKIRKDGTSSGRGAYVDSFKRDGTWGQGPAKGLIAGEGRPKDGQGPKKVDDGAAPPEAKAGNGVGAVAPDGLIAQERAVRDGGRGKNVKDSAAKDVPAATAADGP